MNHDDSAVPASAPVLYEAEGGLAVLRLNRPHVGNAIDLATAAAFHDAVESLAADRSVRAVLLTATGPVFCTGGDVAMFADAAPGDLPELARRVTGRLHAALTALAALDAPVVAAVRGAAAGAGLGLVCAADVVIAAEDAKFAVAYPAIGLSADCAVSWHLPRVLGLRRAQELFLLGRRLSGAEALDWGLVTRLAPADQVEKQALEIAARLATAPTLALGEARRLLRRAFETSLDDQLSAEQDSVATASASTDFAEGVAAFLGKRHAVFRGR